MEELVYWLIGSGLLVLCDTFWVLELGALLKTGSYWLGSL